MVLLKNNRIYWKFASQDCAIMAVKALGSRTLEISLKERKNNRMKEIARCLGHMQLLKKESQEKQIEFINSCEISLNRFILIEEKE